MYLETITQWLTPELRPEIAACYARAGRPYADDPMMLRVLHKERQPRIERIQRAREGRIAFLQQLADFAEDGKIAVVESGRDCDCVDYFGRVHIIDATVDAFSKLYDGIADWADGPFRLDLERPSVAEGIESVSYDRVLEAHEDGHPHHVYSTFGG